MPSTTPIAALPYPLMTEPPDGPGQIGALAKSIDPLLVNAFSDANQRSSRLSKANPGALSYRKDDGVFEYWNGKIWVGLNTTQCIDEANSISVGKVTFTTTESKALATSVVTLKNPSEIYKMFWVAFAEFNARWSSTKDGQRLAVRHHGSLGTTQLGARLYDLYTQGASGSFSGVNVLRTGYLGVLGSITVKNWFTIEKLNTAAGALTLDGGYSSLTMFGVTTV
jgi:hypothetical protein